MRRRPAPSVPPGAGPAGTNFEENEMLAALFVMSSVLAAYRN